MNSHRMRCKDGTEINYINHMQKCMKYDSTEQINHEQDNMDDTIMWMWYNINTTKDLLTEKWVL